MSSPNEIPAVEKPPETTAAPEAQTAAPAATPPAETPTQPAAVQPGYYPPQSPDYGPYLAQQNAVLAGLMQQMQQQRPTEKEEELPDPTLEPDKYVNRVVEKKVQQFQPMLQQMQLQNAVNTALINRDAVAREVGSEWGKYEGQVNELAKGFSPEAFANPAAWKALFFMVKGAEASAPVPAQGQGMAAPTPPPHGPAAPQGQWPGARQSPPPVAQPSSGTPAPTGARRLSDEERKVAKMYGMTDEEYAKYAEEA